MSSLPPLRFLPIYRRAIWGGRRLETVMGKKLGPGDDFSESWEIVDHGKDQSVVDTGPLHGRSLSQLVTQHGIELLGTHASQKHFPLLFKFLDAHRSLSVQVHPDDAAAALLDRPDLGKTEAWVVVHAEPGSVVYAGLKHGFDRAALQREVNRGTTELCLHRIEPKVGDCIFIPAGVVHALGAGLVVAEIQQASDTTFRLFDWNRLGADGKPRALHIQQAMETIDYDIGPIFPQQPQPTDRGHVQRLVDCDKFVLERWQFNRPQTITPDQRCHILSVLLGEVQISGAATLESLKRGETILLPASCSEMLLSPKGEAIMLDMTMP